MLPPGPRLASYPWRWKETNCAQTLMLALVVWTLVLTSEARTDGLVCDADGCRQVFYVEENVPNGTFVGTVTNPAPTAGFNDLIPGTTQQDGTQVFSVALSTGDITTKADLDRETVPGGFYSFLLQTNTTGTIVLVIVRLLDVNDNDPSFTPAHKTLNFSESAPFGAKKSLGSVTDRDLGANSTQTCRIVSGDPNHAFVIQQKKSGNYDIILDLKVNGSLDYEQQQEYQLVVMATDGGGRSGNMTVRIVILDQNDHQPEFNTSKYQVKVSENVTVGTSIIQVEATDRDSGSNARISYSIDNTTDPDAHFRIDPDTGVVRINRPLDYESQSTFTLTLEATDHGPTRLVGNAALEVVLENINEQPANIRLVFLQSPGRQQHIMENTREGTLVARISIDDPDISVERHDDVDVNLFGGDDIFGLQVSEGSLSLVVVNSPPDRENKSSYLLTVTVTDSGTPPLHARQSFTIYIDDQNDNAPVFEGSYEGEVLETADIGTFVVKVTASDRDVGENARLSYSIESGSSPQSVWFAIDSKTGVISTQTPIDCEVNARPVLTVVARDHGLPALSGSTSVVVVVRDVSDKQPEFDTSFYNARVAEDAAIGFCPVKVQATDPECGARSPVSYQLVRSGGRPVELQVGESSGDICIHEPGLDYETSTHYQFLVRAVDTDGQSATAVVQITVTDVNDNSPQFHPHVYALSVESSVPQGPLLTVQASDLDSGDFGTISYSFLTNSADDYFRIDPGSGTISLVKSFPPSTQRVFELQVQGTDRGGRVAPLAASVTISVYSGDVHPPVFSLTMYNFTVPEDAALGVLVGQVEATVQSSAGSTSDVEYSIDYYSVDWFRVVPTTGHIFTKSALDRERQPFVLLSVRAHVSQPQNLSTTAQANFTLLDVNDNSPVFSASSLLTVEVLEATQLSHPVYIALAHDPDLGLNGSIVYHLHNDPHHLFLLDPVTGELYVRTELDYEHHHSYELVIVAQDQAVGGGRSSNMTLTVNVKDVNDNPPVFSQSLYQLQVSEDSQVGHEFGNITATDGDSDHNGRISYSLQPSPHLATFAIFTVQGARGVLTLRERVDRERQEMYKLVVIATDHGTPRSLSATATISIHITDTNDNDPQFSQRAYKFLVVENQDAGTQVGQLTATDRDAGLNQRLQYRLSGAQTSFAVDVHSGELTTTRRLDREEQAEHTLTVIVSDSGQPARTGRALVTVTVLDLNDNTPLFPGDPQQHVDVSENRPKGLSVVQLHAQDLDAGDNGTVSFSVDTDLTEATTARQFHVHPVTGLVTTREVLDFETSPLHHITITARDHGLPPLSSSIVLVVHVIDDDTEGPEFYPSQEQRFSVGENVAVGTLVGRVQRDTRQSESTQFLVVGGNVFGVFNLDSSTGEVRTVRALDYEMASSHTLHVQALDVSGVFPVLTNISVLVQVLDLNDNAPLFDTDPVLVKCVENTPVNRVIHTVVATDSDSGRNGTVRYSIVSQSASGPHVTAQDFFRVGSSTGQLSLTRRLDHEHVHRVTLVIQATDDCPAPSLARSSRLTAVVVVGDVNDQAPVFKSRSEVHVREDGGVGRVVVLVVAVDGDSNLDDSGNNVITYTIVSGNEDGKFRLDPESGRLTIAEPLDRDTRAAYVLNISAEDSGLPRQVAYQQLKVFLEDVNDNTPLFAQSVYQGSVLEHGGVGVRVLTVTAADDDMGSNGNVTYTIPGGVAGDAFSIHPVTGVISTTRTLDREQQDAYTLSVVAKDGGSPPLQAVVRVEVTVRDINDNAPQFSESEYRVTLAENQPHSQVLTILAQDQDTGPNAQLVYSITGGNDGKFQIDPDTGDVSCQALDRESRRQYSLQITATDSGTPRHSGTTTLSVTVIDCNDNSPQFSHTAYSASLREDVPRGATVMRVSASDPDDGDNGHVTYSLTGNDTEGFFSVNSSSGDIITAGVFDREKNASFEFLLVATDGGGSGPRNSTARILITITDINDNRPTFRQIPYTTTTPLDTPAGTVVLQMQAVDPDLGDNGTVSYRLLEDTHSESRALFQVHPTTGSVTTRTSLTPSPGLHSLLVLASDKGSPAMSTTGVARITVGEGGAGSPLTFEQDMYMNETEEHAPVNTTVITVQAAYTGSGAVTYSFVSGNDNDVFYINSVTGEIQVWHPAYLDYESTPSLTLLVSAQADSHHAYTTVQVHLKDKNDNAPKFAQTMYVASIWENNHPQTFVTQVWAKDADSGNNGRVSYSIIFGNTYGIFEMYPEHSGIIRTNINKSPLDREIQSHFTLHIEAQDQGFPPKLSTCKLYITCVDRNDNTPIFPSPGPGPVTLPENTRVGHIVAVVTATDVDLNPILVYDFTVQGNPDHMFSIDRSTGTVRLARPLDHEARSHYTLGLQVTDGEDSATTTLEVNVSDINDNPPRFPQSHFHTSLPHNVPPQTSVIRLLAQDEDQGTNAAISYSLKSASSPCFYVNSSTGTVMTNASLPSSQWWVQLVVAAQDGGSPSLSDMTTLTIHLTAVNSHSPRFDTDEYSASIKESSPRGTAIVKVNATDSDITGHHDNLRYSLTGPYVSTFFIHPDTGHILLSGIVDHETIPRYTLQATATDSGQPPRNATVPVIITIIDDNDNTPVFGQASYWVTLRETYPLNRTFLTLNATDRDLGPHAMLDFSLTSGNTQGVFHCSPAGHLTLLSPLDFEASSQHHLVVSVVDCGPCDQGVPRLASVVTVVVSVSDVNEFPPSFPLPHYHHTVPENLPPGATIFQVQANDRDGGQYGDLSYTILRFHDSALFDVNASTGHVIARTTFDYEAADQPKVYNLTVRTTDPGGWQVTVTVSMSVTDQDEFRPVFSNQSYSFTVPGSAQRGHYVGTIAAWDGDGGVAGRLVFTMDKHIDYFHLDPLSGNMTVAHTLHQDITHESSQDSSDDASQGAMTKRRKKRALVSDSQTIIVQASSGLDNSLSARVYCVINIDRSCVGCQAPVRADLDDGLSGAIIALIVLVCIIIPVVVVLIICFFYRRRTKSVTTDRFDARNAGVAVTPPLEDSNPAPPLKDPLAFSGQHGRLPKPPVSDVSQHSHHSGSSGRGSVEVEEEEEEIRRMNATNYVSSLAALRDKTMPDSGIQHDDESTASNHQEYLARLGIDTSRLGKSGKHSGKGSSSGSTSGVDMTLGMDSPMMLGGGGEALDLDHFTDTDVDEEMVMIENSRRLQQSVAIVPAGGVSFQAPDPQQTGALSHVVNSEEELSGSYNWDYLLDWGPQYQPLAHVFSEIAKLKDESITPKKTPVKTVPQRKINATQSLAMPHARIVPPPIITSAPPPLHAESSEAEEVGERDSDNNSGSVLDHSHSLIENSQSALDGRHAARDTGRSAIEPRHPAIEPRHPALEHSHPALPSSHMGGMRGERGHASSMSSSSGPRSQRSGPLPSLPRSPISYEPTYSSTALPPSFTPSLSPLGTHTPSLSSAVNGETMTDGRGHSGGVVMDGRGHIGGVVMDRRGHLTNSEIGVIHGHPVHPRHHHHHHHHHQPQHHPQHHPHGHSGHQGVVDTGEGLWTHSPSSESDREFRI